MFLFAATRIYIRDPIHLSSEAASAYKHKIMYVFEVCIWYAISFIQAAKMMQLVVDLFSFSFRFIVFFYPRAIRLQLVLKACSIQFYVCFI